MVGAGPLCEADLGLSDCAADSCDDLADHYDRGLAVQAVLQVQGVMNVVVAQSVSNDANTMRAEYDMVNHPKHYISASGIETIDVIEAFTDSLNGYEAVLTGSELID